MRWSRPSIDAGPSIFIGLIGLLAVIGCTVRPLSLKAQAPSDSLLASEVIQWVQYVDGRPHPWPEDLQLPSDSLHQVVDRLLAEIQRAGYYYAKLDSVISDHSAAESTRVLYLDKGPQVSVEAVVFFGAQHFTPAQLQSRMQTQPGRVLDLVALEDDLDALVVDYERSGYALASITLEGLEAVEEATMRVVVRVNEGPLLRIDRVALKGTDRTRPAYVARLAGIKLGRPVAGYNPAEMVRRLEATNLFKTVGQPVLAMDADSAMVLEIPLTEAAPGAFDLVLGYQPPGSAGQGAGVVGNGHLRLSNLFGGGRIMSIKLSRLPGQVSSVDARWADPYVLGLPLRIEGRFDGHQQDSTYGKQRYQAEVGYRLLDGAALLATVSRESTNPGTAGIRLRQGRQRIASADARFVGIGVRYERLDQPLNPRRGLSVYSNFERGSKRREAQRIDPAANDTLLERTALQQERLTLLLQAYLPTWVRQVVSVGGQVYVLRSDAFDQSDLFRLGGATSLRGYDEDRFLGRVAGRLFMEYRYQLDRTSFAYLFFDLGYVERPELPDLGALEGIYPGYGLGIQFSTALGLINASYAISPEDGPANGRVHAGLSFGL